MNVAIEKTNYYTIFLYKHLMFKTFMSLCNHFIYNKSLLN